MNGKKRVKTKKFKINKFGFMIDEDYLNIKKETILDFMHEFNRHFDTWRKEEDEKSRKI